MRCLLQLTGSIPDYFTQLKSLRKLSECARPRQLPCSVHACSLQTCTICRQPLTQHTLPSSSLQALSTIG